MDINYLIDNNLLITYMQPLVNISKRNILGIEALTRGIDEDGKIIPPSIIFDEASKDTDTMIKLDRHCRILALKRFKEMKKNNDKLILFLNIESSIISIVEKSQHLINNVNSLGLSPSEIVLEINESHTLDIESLTSFCNRYRQYGFLIALDDVGSGFSNLNRIPLLNPDIIKVDRFLIKGIDNDYYKQEVLKSLVNLATSIGSIVVAEGVETTPEAIAVLETEVDIIQGFLLSKPVADLTITTPKMMCNIETYVSSFKNHIYKLNGDTKRVLDKMRSITHSVVNILSYKAACESDDVLSELLYPEDMIECIYVLNKSGKQISNTIFKNEYKRKTNSLLYSPAQKGADHSSKKYFFHLVNSYQTQYISDKYISMATGNVCRTISTIFDSINGHEHIVCIDFIANIDIVNL